MPSTCPRCGAIVPSLDGDPALFCPNCGLPQLILAADLPDIVVSSSGHSDEAGSTTAGPTNRLHWNVGLRAAAIASLPGLLPCLLPGAAAGGASALSLLLVPVLTAACVVSYLRVRPNAAMNTGIGARLGAALGVVLAAALALIAGIAGFVLRYGYKSRVVQANVDTAMQQFIAQVQTGPAAPVPPSLIAFLQAPEVRAGTFLSGVFFSSLLLLAASAFFGAIAGWLVGLRRRGL